MAMAPTRFHPTDLRSLTGCAVVNPLGYDDPVRDFDETDLNGAFEDGNNDADISLLKDADFDKLALPLWERANAGAGDHLGCDNGGAYCLWRL